MWKKKGLIFNTDYNHDWMVSHACVPTSIQISEEIIRVYYSPRNKQGQSIPTYFDVSANDPTKVLYVHNSPILELGELGTFDDGGIMPCSAVRLSDTCIYLYYVGWNPSVSVSYRNAIGIAVSVDNGFTFQRMFKGSIVDRNIKEPFFTASPCVLKENNTWHMWYASCTGFIKVSEKTEPLYQIKYAVSANGVDWMRPDITCIIPANKFECTARPSVIKAEGKYKMWYTYRGSFDYRDGVDSYKIGYAESLDGITWIRKDYAAGINFSDTGWDSTMQTYSSVIEINKKRFLFYNGNGFGRTGIGVAEWRNV